MLNNPTVEGLEIPASTEADTIVLSSIAVLRYSIMRIATCVELSSSKPSERYNG